MFESSNYWQSHLDPLNINGPLRMIITDILSSPDKIKQYNQDYIEGLMNLRPTEDKRFSNWNHHRGIADLFSFNSEFLRNLVEKESEHFPPDDAQRVKWFVRQFIDATSPSNSPLLNPMFAKESFAQRGQNLYKGLENLLEDMRAGNITSASRSSFKLGENIATTKGSVVLRNQFIELIHYHPTQDQVYNTPIFIIPPWINKYYVFDMSAHNSMIKWLLSKGHDVYIISWVNPGIDMGKASFDDYLTEGALFAWDFISKRCKKIHVVGYCIGGTLATIMLANLAAKKLDKQVASSTLMSAFIDFSDIGEFASLVSDEQLSALETYVRQKGYISGLEVHQTFSMMRASDMIWRNFVSRYLLGQDAPNIDMLFWNADYTNLPAEMSLYYLQNLYRGNKLVEPNVLTLGGIPIDVRKIKAPTFIMANATDHIVPWKTAYRSTQLWPKKSQFLLSQGGHVSGVISPPTKENGGYFINDILDNDPGNWLSKAKKIDGSWWLRWHEWLTPLSGRQIKAKREKNTLYPAPGEYVLKRS